MITHTEIGDLVGAALLDCTGQEVGTIGQILLEDGTGEPEWATLNTDAPGRTESLVPLAQAERAGNAVRVPYDREMIENAPRALMGDGHLHESQQHEVYAHYGLDYVDRRSDSGQPSGQALSTRTKWTTGEPGTSERDTSRAR